MRSPAVKKVKVSTLKKKVWKVFSLYIRLRDCLYTTGTLTHGKCITCNRNYSFKKLQAGHFVSGHGGAIMFLEDNCHAQCMQCNVFEHGNVIAYYPIMVKMYGQKRVDELSNLKHTISSWTIPDLEKVQKDIQKKIDYLKKL